MTVKIWADICIGVKTKPILLGDKFSMYVCIVE